MCLVRYIRASLAHNFKIFLPPFDHCGVQSLDYVIFGGMTFSKKKGQSSFLLVEVKISKGQAKGC